MEEDTDKEARSAAQGLLDIAIKASRRSVEKTGSRSEAEPAFKVPSHPEKGSLSKRHSSERIAAFRPVPPRSSQYMAGRVITSGNTPPVLKAEKESAGAFRSPEPRPSDKFQQPRPRKPEPQETVTLVVAKPQEDKQDADVAKVAEDDRKASFDLPVPPSAFAIPGRPSVDAASTWHRQHEPTTTYDSDSDRDEARPPQTDKSPRPFKRARLENRTAQMDRTVSINTVLQQVGAKDKLLTESIGRPVQTVQEIVSWPQNSMGKRSETSAFTPVDTQEVGQKLWGPAISSVQTLEPALMPRNSSDRSTLDVHKQLAQQCSSETITNHPSAVRSVASRLEPQDLLLGRSAEVSAERDQLVGQQASVQNMQSIIGSALSVGEDPDAPAGAALPAALQDTQGGAQGGAEDTEMTMWTGQIKHRLKTASGSSVAELFSLHALVPSKLLEQLPPTIFVNVLVGRTNVKLGKHYVANCKLAKPTERQIHKATALANMKLVAICELQHCTVTLVPYMGPDQSLQLVAFLIADE